MLSMLEIEDRYIIGIESKDQSERSKAYIWAVVYMCLGFGA